MNRHHVAVSCVLLAFFFITTLAAGQAPIAARVVEPIDSTRRVTLTGNVHPLARAEFDRGAVSDALSINRVLLLLKRSDQQQIALRDFLEAQEDKNSLNYHAWLSPEAFGAQYGPADADVEAITHWLTQQGFHIVKIYSGKTVIEFSGSAAQVRAAFATDLRNYEVQGKSYVANSSDPQIPAALAPVVAGIVSLNNFPRRSHLHLAGIARKLPGQSALQPLFTFPLGSNTIYAVGPADFATIYNSKPLSTATPVIDGSGQSIAIVGETNIRIQDVEAFRSMFALPGNFTSSNVILNGEDPGITSIGEEGEADLDTEWSGAVAPAATIYLVVSASTSASAGVDLSALYIVEHNFAGVMSESYGACESALGTAGNAFFNRLWEQAAAQGITVVVSAGDGGSAGCDNFNTEHVATEGLAVSGLASTPFNVSVGGTDFDEVNQWSLYWNSNNDPTGSSAKGYIPEIPWNENCAQLGLTGCGSSAPQESLNLFAGTGGPSSIYGKPMWQLGVNGMPNDNHRDQPDVSLFASSGFNGSGYAYCQSDNTISGNEMCNINTVANPGLDFGVIGGTSASAPAFAGIMALVNQYQASHGGSSRQGNANYVLYALAKKSGATCTSANSEAATCVFNDVVKGNGGVTNSVGTNSVPCRGGKPNCSATVTTANGVLVDPAHPTTEAWTATPGYDMTTGLGSLNVDNLVRNWANVSTVSTTTTLSLTPTSSITHGTGENVNVNITVAAATGTAQGDVSLIATLPGPNGTTLTQGLDQFTLGTNGSFNGTTRSLPGGNAYQVYAHYAGDGTNAPSDSQPITVSIAQEPSQTFIVVPTFDSNGHLTSGNTTSVPYGSSYVLRMYVTDKNSLASSTGPPSPTCDQVNPLTCPTGTVTLTDNGSPVGLGGGGTGIYKLNSAGYTRDLAPTLSTGTHSLVATYSGDNSFLSSKTSASVTVSLVPTSITESLNMTSPIAGTPFGVTVQNTSQSSVGFAPTGTLTFYDGSTQLANPVPVQGSSTGYFSVGAALTIQSPGNHTLTVNYSGDAVFASASARISFKVVNATTSSIAFTPSNVIYGGTVTVTGLINTSVPASNAALKPTGTVTVYAAVDGVLSQGVVVTPMADPHGNWELQVTATFAPTVTENFQMNYSGDGNYGPSNVISNGIVTVTIPDFSLSANPSNLVISASQSGTLQFNVVPATNLSSSVSLQCSPSESQVGNLPAGYGCTVQPNAANLSNGAAATGTVLLAPLQTPSRLKNVSRPHAVLVSVPSGTIPLWPTGMLAGLVALLCLCLPRRKYRSASVGFGLIGLFAIMASCGGGNSGMTGGGVGTGPGGGGTGATAPYTTTTTLTANTSKVGSGSSVSLTAQVIGQGSPTGTVSFYASGYGGLGQADLVSGTASLTVPMNFPGVYSFTANYGGDAKNVASTSTPIDETVTGSASVYVVGTTGNLVHSVPLTVTLQ